MKSLVLANRTFKEIVRDPLSVVFCVLFPVVLFLLFALIANSFNVADLQNDIPQFMVQNLCPAICIFAFSFVTLFSGMIISKDRTTSFQLRLNISPVKSYHLVCGYTLPCLLITVVQTILVFILSFIFGLQFNANVLLAFVLLIPSMFLFIAFGLMLGAVFSDKAVGGVASIIINLAVLLSGMFFPLQNMSGAINTIAEIFPFRHGIIVVNSALTGNYGDIWQSLLILCAYTVVFFALAIFLFNKKMRNKNN